MHLEDFLATFHARVERALDAAADEAVAAAKASAPEASGELRRSVRVTSRTRGQRVVQVTAPYAGFVENGRDAIEAPAGGALRFFVGGVEVVVRRVGPAKASRFMVTARDEVDRTIRGTFEDELLRGAA